MRTTIFLIILFLLPVAFAEELTIKINEDDENITGLYLDTLNITEINIDEESVDLYFEKSGQKTIANLDNFSIIEKSAETCSGRMNSVDAMSVEEDNSYCIIGEHTNYEIYVDKIENKSAYLNVSQAPHQVVEEQSTVQEDSSGETTAPAEQDDSDSWKDDAVLLFVFILLDIILLYLILVVFVRLIKKN